MNVKQSLYGLEVVRSQQLAKQPNISAYEQKIKDGK